VEDFQVEIQVEETRKVETTEGSLSMENGVGQGNTIKFEVPYCRKENDSDAKIYVVLDQIYVE
jgi:hypothetical protein